MDQHGKHRSLVIRLKQCASLVFVLGMLGLASHGAAAPCRQALALGLDVSGSVDSREYRMQLDGVANALSSPDVAEVLLALPDAPVRIFIYEWSGPNDQHILIPWTDIHNARNLRDITAKLNLTKRTPSEQSTALGHAMRFGANALSTQSKCWKRTLDISGDGKSNTGIPPQDISNAQIGSVTVNALVIGADPLDHGDSRQAEIGELSSYFNAYVLRGPNAFVEVALGFEDYERALIQKLLRELEGVALSGQTPTSNLSLFQ